MYTTGLFNYKVTLWHWGWMRRAVSIAVICANPVMYTYYPVINSTQQLTQHDHLYHLCHLQHLHHQASIWASVSKKNETSAPSTSTLPEAKTYGRVNDKKEVTRNNISMNDLILNINYTCIIIHVFSLIFRGTVVSGTLLAIPRSGGFIYGGQISISSEPLKMY